MRSPAQPAVLIIEDSPKHRAEFRRIAAELGWRIYEATDAASAEKAVRDFGPRVAVVDMNTSDVDAAKLFASLKRSSKDPGFEILALGGNPLMGDLALREGATHFLPHPVDEGSFVAVIERALSQAVLPPRRHVETESLRVDEAIRAELVSKVERSGENFKTEIRKLLGWLSGYLGSSLAAINLVEHEILRSYAMVVRERLGSAFFEPAPISKTLCGEVARTQRSLSISDVRVHPVYSGVSLAHSGVVAYAAAPLTTPAGLAIGSLCVESIHPMPLVREDGQLLENLAARIGRSFQEVAVQGYSNQKFLYAEKVLDESLTLQLADIILEGVAREFNVAAIAIMEIKPTLGNWISKAFRSGRRTMLGVLNPRTVVVLGPQSAVQEVTSSFREARTLEAEQIFSVTWEEGSLSSTFAEILSWWHGPGRSAAAS